MRLSYSAARQAEPIEVEIRGNVYTFPADLPADGWLAFIERWGDHLTADDMPPKVLVDFVRMVVGGDRLEELRKELSMRELLWLAPTLWQAYMGGEAEGGTDDAHPPNAST